MYNAKKEFDKHQQEVGYLPICANLQYKKGGKYSCYEVKAFSLKQGYSEKEYRDFLEALDFKYDDGHGAQEVFGLILFSNGSFSRRDEYDGSERWENLYIPSVEEVMEYEMPRDEDDEDEED